MDDAHFEHQPAEPAAPADRVGGTAVCSVDGLPLGRIADVVVHKPTGRIAYAILASGGMFFGWGRTYRAVPYDLLDYDLPARRFVSRLTPEDLRIAPELDRSELPGWSDAAARRRLYDYYGPLGATPYWR